MCPHHDAFSDLALKESLLQNHGLHIHLTRLWDGNCANYRLGAALISQDPLRNEFINIKNSANRFEYQK